MRRLFFLFPALVLLSLRSVADPAALKPTAHDALVARRFALSLPREHLTHEPLDASISMRAWTNFLTSLDYEHVIFLEQDLADFRNREADLGGSLKAGETDFAYDVFDVFLRRLTDRCAYVNRLLDQGFDVNLEEAYVWKRKDAPWPTGEAEWNEIWRKKIKNEYVAHVVSQRMAAEERRCAPICTTRWYLFTACSSNSPS